MDACVITVLLFCNITEQKHKWSETCCQHFYLESNMFFIRNWNITFVNATSIIFNWPQLSARVAIPAEVKLPHCASTIDCSCLQCFPIAYSTRKKVLVDEIISYLYGISKQLSSHQTKENSFLGLPQLILWTKLIIKVGPRYLSICCKSNKAQFKAMFRINWD